MSEILGKIDVNNYSLQNMVAGSGGGKEEDLTIELGAQDTALSTQQTRIDELESALDNKIALDLADATSDADAVASDIAKDKTAYVDGVKLVGTAQGSVPDWSQIGLDETPQSIIDDFDYSKQIYDNWDSNITTMNSCYSQNTSLVYFPKVDVSNVSNMSNAFNRTYNLKEIPSLNSVKLTNMWYMCHYSQKLKEIGLLITNNVTTMDYAFSGCIELSNQSLNNILAMCTNSAITTDKTLKKIGLSQTQAEICKTLSNWDAFVAAGWSTGYDS